MMKSCETGVALKSLGEKSCELKGSGQEMAAKMLMIINFNNNATSIIKVY